MKDHKLTKAQANRLGMPQLAGQVVQAEMYQPGDKFYRPGKNDNIAKDVYYKGERIGGLLALNE